jgi:hypothetical protein
MAGTFKFVPTPGIGRKVASDPKLGVLVGALARQGASAARSSAPSGPTGQYKGSIVVGSPRMGLEGMTCAFGSEDWGWHFVEFGSINNRPYRVLERAARSLGVRYQSL